MFSETLWERIKDRATEPIAHFAKRDGHGPPLGLNNRLRVLHYSNNDHFVPHFDLVVADDNQQTHSLLTVLVYLNDGDGADFQGGETLFLDQQNVTKGGVGITPRAGRVVLFEHELFHAGSLLKHNNAADNAEESTSSSSFHGNRKYHGSKYVMRTDVMFTINHETNSSKHGGNGVSKKKALVVENAVVEDLSVTAMLERLDLLHLNDALADFGLLGTLDSFKAAGEVAVKAMLEETEASPAEISLILGTAFKY
jgi:hypothetical protein